MTALFLRDLRYLNDSVSILDVGAGTAQILFWLARRVRRVVAVDIYGRGRFREREATRAFLQDPSAFAPYDYPADRLEVRDMDAHALAFADETFDVAVSLSSIEHFGTFGDVAETVREMARVVKRTGHVFIATEVFVREDPTDRVIETVAGALRGVGLRRRAFRLRGDVFRPQELWSRVIEPSGLRLMQPLDVSLSDEAWVNVQRLRRDGSVRPSPGGPFPHVLMQMGRSKFTSVCLPLAKSA